MNVFIFLSLVVLIYFIWLKIIFHRLQQNFANACKQLMKSGSNTTDKQLLASQIDEVRALIVTAHPDDECMFFAPTILKLVEINARVHVLCLSQGNYYSQGAQRQVELLDSCAVFGIPSSRVTIVDHKELPDDPNSKWSISLTSAVILKHIRAKSINLVLTFDDGGVSGHANHIALHRAVSFIASSGKAPDDCCLLSLVTIGIFRKYLSFIELPISWFLPSNLCCTLGLDGYKQAKRAMLSHRTQLLWFRYLYILFSRTSRFQFEVSPRLPASPSSVHSMTTNKTSQKWPLAEEPS